jgi:hypothetical protein
LTKLKRKLQNHIGINCKILKFKEENAGKASYDVEPLIALQYLEVIDYGL